MDDIELFDLCVSVDPDSKLVGRLARTLPSSWRTVFSGKMCILLIGWKTKHPSKVGKPSIHRKLSELEPIQASDFAYCARNDSETIS